MGFIPVSNDQITGGTHHDQHKEASQGKSYDGFTDEERAAMKDHAEELKTAARRGPGAAKADGEGNVLAKVSAADEQRISALVQQAVS